MRSIPGGSENVSLTDRAHDGPTAIGIYLALRKLDVAGYGLYSTQPFINSPQPAHLWLKPSHSLRRLAQVRSWGVKACCLS